MLRMLQKHGYDIRSDRDWSCSGLAPYARINEAFLKAIDTFEDNCDLRLVHVDTLKAYNDGELDL